MIYNNSLSIFVKGCASKKQHLQLKKHYLLDKTTDYLSSSNDQSGTVFESVSIFNKVIVALYVSCSNNIVIFQSNQC